MTKPFVPKAPFGTQLPGGSPLNIDINFLNQVGQVLGSIMDTHTHGPSDYGAQIPLSNIPSDPTHPQLPLTTDTTNLGRDADVAMLKAAIGHLVGGAPTVDFRQAANVGPLAVLNPTTYSSTTGTLQDVPSGPIPPSSVVTAAAWTATAGGTLTYTASNTFAVGQRVWVSGMTPAGWNGGFTIAALVGPGPTFTGFTVTGIGNPGAATALGIATGATDFLLPNSWATGTIVVGTQLLIDTVASGIQETVRVVEVQTSGSTIIGFTAFQWLNTHASGVTYSIATQAGSVVLSSGSSVEAGQHVSTVPEGTPPMVVASPTTVTGMSVEMVNGMRTSTAVGPALFADPSYVPGATYIASLNTNGYHDPAAIDYDALESQTFTDYTPGVSTILDSFAHVRSVLGQWSTSGNLTGNWYDVPDALVTDVTVNGSAFPAGELDLTFNNGIQASVASHALTVWLQLTAGLTSGPPSSGTWNAGMLYADNAYKLYICSATGTPGTWSKIGTQT